MGKSIPTGAGPRGGRRPNNLRTDKGELERVLRALSEFGLGSRIIGRLTGYSASQICQYQNYWDIPHASPVKSAEWFESLLPADLRSAIAKIRTRSTVYVERAKAKREPRTPYTHRLLDGRALAAKNARQPGADILRPKET